MATSNAKVTGWVGWIWFAALMMVFVGLFSTLNGLSAIGESDVYVGTKNASILLDVSQWGWVHLILGILMFIVGIALISGALWARIAAALIIMLSALSTLMLLPAYPVWGAIVVALEVVILWAVIVHGEEAANAGL